MDNNLTANTQEFQQPFNGCVSINQVYPKKHSHIAVMAFHMLDTLPVAQTC